MSSNQLKDSSQGRKNLELSFDYTIDNPPSTGSSIVYPHPSVPQGDRWLGKLIGGTNGQADSFISPTPLNPSQGFIKFFINTTVIDPTDHLYADLFYYQADSNFDIGMIGNDSNLIYLNFIDTLSNEQDLIFNQSKKFFDGQTHEVVVSWDGSGTKSYVDGILDAGASVSGTPTLTGSLVYSSILTAGNSGHFTESIYIDDFIISSGNYAVGGTQDEKLYTARYKGDSFEFSSIDTIVHYKMNDNASNTDVVDSSLNNITGAAIHNTDSISVAGVINTALSFNGTDDTITLATPATSGAQYSFATWVKIDSYNGEETQIIVVPDSVAGISLVNNKFFSWDGSPLYGSTIFSLGTWYHVAVTSDGVNKKIYVNGNLENSSAASNVSGWNSGTISIGSFFGGSRFFNGKIDDLRVYNGALTKDLIGLLYNQGMGSEGELPSPMPSQLFDFTNSGYNLTSHIAAFAISNPYDYPDYNDPPEGDRWLARWDESSADNNNEALLMPLETRPNNAGGKISFYLKISPGANTSSDIYNFDTWDNSDWATERFIYIYPDHALLLVNYTPVGLGTDSIDVLLNCFNITDGNTHKIEVRWDGTYLYASVDGVNVDLIDHSNNILQAPSPDFGSGTYRAFDKGCSLGDYIDGLNGDQKIWLDDFAIKDENGEVIARWKGNSNGQYIDDSINKYNLGAFGGIQNPKSSASPDVPAAPEGDRWLYSNQSGNGYLGIPQSAIPHSEGGYISFYVNSPNSPAYIDIIGLDRYDRDGNERYFYIYSDIGTLNVEWTDNDGVDNQISFMTSAFDGSTHFIKVTWDESSVLAYIDNNLDAAASGTSVNFGDADYTAVYEMAIGSVGAGSSVFIDKVRVADENNILIAEWEGNSNGGWLYDSTGNGNTLVEAGARVSNPPANRLSSPPEGDRWLGHWDSLSSYNNEGSDFFKIPFNSRPHSMGGTISFYINSYQQKPFGNIFDLEVDSGFPGPGTDYRYFYIYCDTNDQNIVEGINIEWLDENFDDNNIAMRADVFDGATHKIDVIWDNTAGTLATFVDNVADISISGTSFNFGKNESYQDFFGVIGNQIGADSRFDLLIDDFIIKDEVGNVIAEWKGNSDGQLLGSPSQNNNRDLGVRGYVGNFPIVTPPVIEVANPPQGDRWLGRFGFKNSSGDAFVNSNEIAIDPAHGFIKFFVRENIIDQSFHTFHDFFEMYDNNGNFVYIGINSPVGKEVALYVNTVNSGNYFTILDNSINILDGNTHEIVFSWSSDGIKLYVDGSLDSNVDQSQIFSFSNSPDGVSVSISPIFIPALSEGEYSQVDDVIISSVAYVPET